MLNIFFLFKYKSTSKSRDPWKHSDILSGIMRKRYYSSHSSQLD